MSLIDQPIDKTEQAGEKLGDHFAQASPKLTADILVAALQILSGHTLVIRIDLEPKTPQ